jgi:hypothetical protein
MIAPFNSKAFAPPAADSERAGRSCRRADFGGVVVYSRARMARSLYARLNAQYGSPLSEAQLIDLCAPSAHSFLTLACSRKRWLVRH